MSSGFSLLSLLLILFSCTSKLTDSSDSIAVACHVDQARGQGAFLQVLNPDGQPLNPDQISNLTTEFLNARGLLSHPRLTAGACVELPDEAGQLAVVDAKSKAGLYWVSAGHKPLFLKRPLLKKTQMSLTSLCEGENRFANTQLKRDWDVTSDGSLQNMRLRVQARNVHDDRTFVLFQKEFGEELLLPEYWSTADLREGQYRLEVLQQELINGLETAATRVSFSADCPLTVLHHAPMLLGLTDGSLTIPVVDTDKGLDAMASESNGSVFVCMEERSALPQDLSEGHACEASASCRDPANFKALGQEKSVAEGIYNVFAYAKDQADNRGTTQCRTMIFSSQAPQFDVRWVKEKWNGEGAVLDETPAIVRANIVDLSHPNIPGETLTTGLECKIEVILRSVETVATPRLTCTEGRCKGQPLDVYRPCDSHIGIGLYEFWKSSYSRHATLRLKVRASDKAHHSREKSLNLVLDSGQWTREALALPPSIALAPQQLVEDESGHILGLGGEGVTIWQDGSLKDITPGPSQIEALRTKDNTVYFFTGDTPEALQISRWAAGTWKPVGELLNFGDSGSVSTFIHPRKGFWIYSAHQAYLVQDDQVFEVPAFPENFIRETRFSIDESNRIWACFHD